MTGKTRAAIYTRISRDPEGKEAGVERQEIDCRALADRLGLAVVEVFQDNDISASTKSTKRRPRYEAMLDAATRGEVDVILAYSNSRLTRRPAEWITLINLAQSHGVQIKTVVSGSHDLSTADGRAVALTIATWDAAEAERVSERISRANRGRAEKGKPICPYRSFGYLPKTVKDGQLVHEANTKIDPAEAKLLRAAKDHLLAGGVVSDIAKDWNKSGVTTVRGGRWTQTAVRETVIRPTLAGIQVYRGQKIGMGDWEPIFTLEEHEALVSLFDARKTGPRTGKTTYSLLSGLAVCGKCGGRIYGGKARNGSEKELVGTYRCEVPHLSRKREPIDAVVIQYVIARLQRPDAADLVRDDARMERLEQLRSDAAVIRTRLDSLAVMLGAGDIDPAGYATATKVARNQLEAIETEQAGLTGNNALAAVVGAGVDVAEVWETLSLERQRAIIETLLEPVVINTGIGGRNKFDPSTIVIKPRI